MLLICFVRCTVLCCVESSTEDEILDDNYDFAHSGRIRNDAYSEEVPPNATWSSRHTKDPRGSWKGPHQLSLSFEFSPTLQTIEVFGTGTDDIGEFFVEGIYCKETRRMGLTRRYKCIYDTNAKNFRYSVTAIRMLYDPPHNRFGGSYYVYKNEDEYNKGRINRIGSGGIILRPFT